MVVESKCVRLAVSILLSLVSISCAVGVVDPLPEEVEESPVQKQLPPPVEPEKEFQSDCIVNNYRINNCYVKEVYCQGRLKRLDVSCDRGRELFPWEYIPDPPFFKENNE